MRISDGAIKRLLLLYGAYSLINSVVFVLGYYLLPEGLLRGKSPAVAVVSSAQSFGAEFALTLVFNLGLVTAVAVGMNLFHVKGIPGGYLYPPMMGIVTGLVTGTNSFASPDAMQMGLREGLAAGISIGGAEMLGYLCVIAATVKLGVFQYDSWFQVRATTTGRLRDVRLDRTEITVLALGLLLVLFAAFVETVDVWRVG